MTPSDSAYEIGTAEARQVEAILRDGVLAMLGPVLEQPGAKEVFSNLRAREGLRNIVTRTNFLPDHFEVTTYVTPGFTPDHFRDIYGYTTDAHVVIRAAEEVADSDREFTVGAIEEKILEGDSTTAGKVRSDGLLNLLAEAGARHSDRFGVAPDRAEFYDAVVAHQRAVELYRTSENSRLIARPGQAEARHSRLLNAVREVTNLRSSGAGRRRLARAQGAAQEARRSLLR